MLNYKEIRENQKYLPSEFRDSCTHQSFHNQKDFFKSMWILIDSLDTEKKYNKYNWTQFHVNSIDLLLYGLARYGYVLSKSRKKLEFVDYDDVISNINKRTGSILLGNKDAVEQEEFKIVVDEKTLSWIEKKEHLPVDFREKGDYLLSFSYLIKSIDASQNFITGRLTNDDRFVLIDLFLENAAKFGFILRKQTKPGNFDNIVEIIKPYRKAYDNLMSCDELKE